MKFFLMGGHDINAGPSNVNKSLIANSDGDMLFTHSNNKAIRKLETIVDTIKSDRILISGAASSKNVQLIRILHKRFYYLMHGCSRYENEINHLNISEDNLEAEDFVLTNADKIICVSEGYAKWVKNRYPQYADRITFVNNGITLQPRSKVDKIPLSIAVGGGNRYIKNNGEVYKAVKALNAEGYACKLYVFGRKYPDNDPFINADDIVYCGHLNKQQYYDQLDRIALFIIDSEVEPFGLGIADALNCNCSLLLSKNVGSRYVMTTEESDIIQDPHNTEEIVQKIKNVLRTPNADRLYASIDREDCSEKSAYRKIKQLVEH